MTKPINHFNKLIELRKIVDNIKDKHNLNMNSFFYYKINTYFGTFPTIVNTIKFSSNSIDLFGVKPINCVNTNDIEICIPFEQINSILYCFESSKPSIFIKTSIETNVKIKISLFSDNIKDNENWKKYDANSSDIRENYIKILFANRLTKPFIEYLEKSSINSNKEIICFETNAINAENILNLNPNKTQNMSLNASISKVSQQLDWNSKTFNVMFGAFDCILTRVEFDLISIKLIGVVINSIGEQIHIIIPFKEIQHLLYCSQQKQTSIFIRTNPKLNDQIKRSLNIESNRFGEKFDYISVIFANNKGFTGFEQFMENLTADKLSVNYLEINPLFAEHLIECNKTLNQLIYSNNNIIDSNKLGQQLIQRIDRMNKNSYELRQKCTQLLRNEWLCPLCSQNCSNGSVIVSLNCGHVFCETCLRNGNIVTKSCPTCRKHIREGEIKLIFQF